MVLPFVQSDKGSAQLCEQCCSEYDALVCFECQLQPYFYPASFALQIYNDIIFINHVLYVKIMCSVPSHSRTILNRFSTEDMETLIYLLNEAVQKETSATNRNEKNVTNEAMQ